MSTPERAACSILPIAVVPLVWMSLVSQPPVPFASVRVTPAKEEPPWTPESDMSSKMPEPTYTPRKGCLMFLHIPKTAGTSIEEAMQDAREQNPRDVRYRPWGVYDGNIQCTKVSDDDSWVYCEFRGGAKCSPWHVPPAEDPRVKKAYESCDTFCVIRHPIARLVSEWHFEHPKRPSCSFREFERFVQAGFRRRNDRRRYDADCHLLPQTDYIPDCTHIVRYENLKEDFPRLMAAYNLNVTLKVHHFHSITCTDWRIKTPLLAQIRTWYADDFEQFGYA